MNRASPLWTLLACAALAAVTAAAYLSGNKRSDRPSEAGKQFHEQLLAIAKNYRCIHHVDVEIRWAPPTCATVGGPYYTPAEARLSHSNDAETHGRKLYFLFAKDRDAYLALSREKNDRAANAWLAFDPQSVGLGDRPLPDSLQALQQFVVKQSWKPVKVVDIDKERLEPVGPGHPLEGVNPYASRDGKVFYRAGEQGDLFIMLKLGPETPETDNGWVYGTVTADGTKVTSAGRVESCMSCHKDAKHDRLFGLAKAETAEKPEKEKK